MLIVLSTHGILDLRMTAATSCSYYVNDVKLVGGAGAAARQQRPDSQIFYSKTENKMGAVCLS